MRVAVKLGAVDDYELAAVAAHGLRSGGVANTSTPNYVYRWSEREVEKTVASFAPHARHRIRFFREFELPEALVEIDRGARASGARHGASRCDHDHPDAAATGEPVCVLDREAADSGRPAAMDAGRGGRVAPRPKVVGRRYGTAA